MILELKIRNKWSSPKHSTDPRKDDSHEFKKKILKEIGARNFEKYVGRNPDLDVDPKTRKIVLKGRAGSKKKKIYASDLNAGDYFIFILSNNKKSFDVEYLTIENVAVSTPTDLPKDEIHLWGQRKTFADIFSSAVDLIFESEPKSEIFIIVHNNQIWIDHEG